MLGQNFWEKGFFTISSPSSPTFGGKNHWVLAVDDSNNFIWSFFLKEKSDLVDIMSDFINNLKNKYNLHVQYLCCDNAGENVAFKKVGKQKVLGLTSSIQPQVHHNKMAMLKENLLPFSTGYIPCSTVAISKLT